MTVVADTNVAVVADGLSEQASEDCMETCAEKLEEIMRGEVKLALDDDWQILGEYTRNLHSTGADVGDRFLQWTLRNWANPQRCDLVSIMPINNLEKVYVMQTNGKIVQLCFFMTTDPGDLVLNPTCVRKGTKIFTLQNPNPPISPRKRGDEISPPPLAEGLGEVRPRPPVERLGEINLTPIEDLRPGDWILSHTGKPRRIRRVIRKPYRGHLIGIQHNQSSTTLWATSDHYIRCKQRILSYGKDRAWSEVPPNHFGRARELRKEMTSAEKALWSRLRGKQLGIKFRKQHPIGPYITDFYARDVELIVEADGDTHFTPEAKSYDTVRTDYLSQLGLTVLRFTNLEILQQLDSVMEQINHAIQTVRPSETPLQQWRRSDTLRLGDIVYFGIHRKPVEIVDIQRTDTDEEVYDLDIETDHSYLTEVCVAHNCVGDTIAYVAENWGRWWITTDTSRVAVALARQHFWQAPSITTSSMTNQKGVWAALSTKRFRISPSEASHRTPRLTQYLQNMS